MFGGLSVTRCGKRAKVLGAVLMTTTAMVGIVATPAVAQTASAQRNFDIPAQSLPQALMIFGRQAGLQVTAEGSVTTGKTSAAISGDLAPAEALSRLLTGTGLTFRFVGNNGVQIEPAPQSAEGAIQLGPVRVEGTLGQGMGQSTENTETYAAGMISAGSKTPVTLRETPQSVSVITSDLIRDKSMVTLNDAMKLVPGVTVQKTAAENDNFYSRGFLITNIQIDGASAINSSGGAGSFYSDQSYNLAMYDHIEVLRGASGLFLGAGDPGGTINLSRKRPLDHYQLKFEAAAGSWQNYRGLIDLTAPLIADGSIRGRIVGEYVSQDYFYKNRSLSKPFVYGILEWDISVATMLTVGGNYEERHMDGYISDMPRYIDGSDIGLSRSTGFGQPWSYRDSSSRELFAKIDHEFSDSWKFNSSYTFAHSKYEVLSSFVDGYLDPVTLTGPTLGGSFIRMWNRQHTFDANISGDFTLFGQQHDIVVGVDYQNIQSRWQGANGPSNKWGYVNVFDPDSTPWSNPYPIDRTLYRDYSPNDQTQYATYLRLGLQLADPWKLALGGRLTKYKFQQRYTQRDVVVSDVSVSEPVRLIPYVGLTYEVSPQWSAYASYAETFTPQQRLLRGPVDSGEVIDPMTGKTYEIGLKGELLGGLLNTSAALFYISRTNQGVLDPTYPSSGWLYDGLCCYVNQGKVVSKGLDLEIAGEVLPGLQLIAGYTFNKTDDKTSNTKYSTITPEHIGKIWAVYQLAGALSRVKFGGGLTVQSASYTTGSVTQIDKSTGEIIAQDVPFDFTQKGYALVDAMVEYKLNDNLNITFNINNIFDKTYYATVGSSWSGNFYGEPQNVRFTVRYSF